MRIGIDLDDTICRTSEMVHEKMDEYSAKTNRDVLEIMSNELIREQFFNEYLPIIYKEVVIKHDVKDVIRRLRNKGNEIYIITGRKQSQIPNIMQITDKWLEDNGIEFDGLFTSAYGDTKADVCKREHIDLMVDDNPYNYKTIVGNGGKCLLFDDRDKYDLRQDYVTSWLAAEEYINKFRG